MGAIYWILGLAALAVVVVILAAFAFNPDGSKGGD